MVKLAIMNRHHFNYKLLLVPVLVVLIAFAFLVSAELAHSSGFLIRDGAPVGGDFINMWTVARLLLEGNLQSIYAPDAFMEFQRTIIPADIGLRLWAYPPHSLPLALPLGFLPYYQAIVLWSMFGLGVLYYGARRFGFNKIEAAIILLSPASLASLYFGQTGNFATGLTLLALSARSSKDKVSIIAAAVLTIKPQIGFLLPVLWAIQRRWTAIILTTAVSLAIIVGSISLFGWETWHAYLFETLPRLSSLEREGTGPFMLMIPSAFMTFRIVLDNGSLAANLHLVFAAIVAAFLIWQLTKTSNQTAQSALLLIGTTLITPYLHNYDLALLLSGALLVARLHPDNLLVFFFVVMALFLPIWVMILNGFEIPVSPLLILPLLLLASRSSATS